MKLFQVVYEQDGENHRSPGKTSTDIERTTMSFCAENIQTVWNAIDWLLNDPERTVVTIAEVLPQVSVLKEKQNATD